jgi:ornithine cyclodeaminase/alanine dehydrogenase-like protein (mu-crystallin family)
VSGRAELFLGIIAVATLATAIVQVGVLVAAGLLARRLQRAVETTERELKPLLEHLNAIGRDASHAASLATAQVERADRLFADLAQRIEQILELIQSVVTGPIREGAAVMSALRAILSFMRDSRAGRRSSRTEDEDALFV